MVGPFARSLAIAIVAALLRAPAARGLVPTQNRMRISSPLHKPSSPSLQTPSSSLSCDRREALISSPAPPASLSVSNSNIDSDREVTCEEKAQWWQPWDMPRISKGRRRFIIPAALVLASLGGLPSPSSASMLSRIPSPTDMKAALVSIIDTLSQSGVRGMIAYVLAFTLWTMTVGVTTPVETAAGMAFPFKTAVILSSTGKIGGAFFQYVLAKYLFSEYAREKMKDNEWMDKINKSFKKSPYRVALIWRFSPLPEFVKNVGPALVPTLRTRYQILAILTHGIPFTILWSGMGSEAAKVARGGTPSALMKRLVAAITWVGLVVSPTLFGWWIRGLGEESMATEGTEEE